MTQWKTLFDIFWNSSQGKQLQDKVDFAYANSQVYPPRDELFKAFELTPLDQVKVVILGQDPYHGPGQANGLAFSVHPFLPLPPSLRNIYHELENDLAVSCPNHGDLQTWADQGVLLLNTCLTVEAGKAHSHKKFGWENFTQFIIKEISRSQEHVVFILWGNHAQTYKKYIDCQRHKVIESTHPSPLSAYRGFFGSRPFSKANADLIEWGLTPIQWRIDPII